MEFSNNGDKINIPDEYIGKVNFRKFEGEIKKRKSKDKVFRFYHKLINFLKFKYRGSLPRDIISLARKFGYDDFLVALFSLTEEEYKKVYTEQYKNFFENKSEEERDSFFESSDFGARSVFELEQDAVASNIFEDMIVYHSMGMLSANNEATGRTNFKVTTKCDLIYEKFSGTECIRVPIELKTKWCDRIEERVNVRGNAKKIIADKGMILVLFTGLFDNEKKKPIPVKYALVDTCESEFKSGTFNIADKNCEYTSINDVTEFNFWKPEEMKRMLDDIYNKYKQRQS